MTALGSTLTWPHARMLKQPLVPHHVGHGTT